MKYVVTVGKYEHDVWADSVERVDDGLVFKFGGEVVTEFWKYDSMRSVHEKAPLNHGPVVRAAEERFKERMVKVQSRQRRLRGGR